VTEKMAAGRELSVSAIDTKGVYTKVDLWKRQVTHRGA